ncbi:putative membrane protein [Clostridium cavendishii DSM 21758]|uniref:Putative membrane protein n=1 Tax=Clostridium cavendishii DSM 21758 TaxID=1121302 RepID=A0A1M6GAK0_9CLOT|nr:YhgE/Pip domain-containing protein [Clostridium cavendishii]SHJ06948.1 putative membrane protein [Clostridium cavendishii DSM 21758]
MKVFKSDLKSIFKNPVALIITLGICVIPALYAWVNIKACWDPYGNTGTMPIAVVNNDKGTTVMGEKVNVGQEVIGELKNNKKIGWKFVSKEQADMGVVDGTYFASIEIPETFSEDLASISKDNTKKAQITYKLDTKANPVAGKIAGGAEGYLVDEITSNFIATVNKKAFGKVSGYKEEVDKNRNDIIKLKNSIIDAGRNMDTIIGALENVNANSTNLNTYLKAVQGTMPALTGSISISETTAKNAESLIQTTNTSLTTAIKTLDNNLKEMKVSIDKIIKILDTTNSNQSSMDITNEMNDINKNIELINTTIDKSVEYLKALNEQKPNEQISQMIVSLKSLEDSLNKQNTLITAILKDAQNGGKSSDELIKQLKNNLQKISTDINNITGKFEKETVPVLNEITTYLTKATKDAATLLKNSQNSVEGINKIVNSATEGSNLTAKVSGDLLEQLKEYKDEIKYIGEKLSKINDNDLNTILAVLQNNPDLMGEFVANPFSIKEVKVYSVPNYGSAMAPVYSVLAIWVGGLILTSVLGTEAKKFKRDDTLTIRHKYFGKMILFVVLAIIQGAIIAIGNIFLLKIYVVNPFLMTVFSILSGITFSIIIFTNVSLLGNVGKAINIVFMIIQLAGCGGSYPIQVDPLIFRILQPLFPFTYSVGGFREAIAGPLSSSVVLDIVMLLLFSILYIIFGFVFKPHLHSIVKRFEKKFHQSGIGE